MKICKACKTEIHPEATKCPHCQSFQNWWSPFKATLPILLTLGIIYLMLYFFSFGISRPNFEDYKESVVFTKLSEEVEISDKGTHYLKIVGEIDNQSKETWKRPTFKVNFFDETGEFKTLIYERDHYVSIAPKTKEKVAFKILIGKNKSDYNYKVELEDMSQY